MTFGDIINLLPERGSVHRRIQLVLGKSLEDCNSSWEYDYIDFHTMSSVLDKYQTTDVIMIDAVDDRLRIGLLQPVRDDG